MAQGNAFSANCPIHGAKLHRKSCRACNRAYMNAYNAERRRHSPAREMWDRARKRAQRLGIAFQLPREAVVIPEVCPALGAPIGTSGPRTSTSPSLDRIRPEEGYVLGNVRVLSDYANRLKGDLTLADLERRQMSAEGQRAIEYARLAEYVRREALLAEVRAKAALGGRVGAEWAKIARFLDKAFIRADWQR
jgi:hypothetical protein